MQSCTHRLLQLSEKIFKTDIRYLAKGGFWASLGYLIQVALGIINTVILANFLQKDLLGTYQFILAIASIVSMFTLSGMGAAIARAVAQGHEQSFRSGIITKLRWSLGSFLIALSIATYYFIQGNDGLALAFLFVALTVPLTETFVLYESYLQGKQTFKDIVILGLWRKPIPVLALIITLYFTTSVPILIGVYLGTTLLVTVIIFWQVIRKYRPPRGRHDETISYSKQLSIMGILGQVSEHGDKVLLWHLLGPVAVASFAIAQLATRYSAGLADFVSIIGLPKVAQRDLLTLQKTLPRKVWLYTLALIPVVTLYILIIPPVFKILFPLYPESILMAQILGVSIFLIPHRIYGQVLLGHKQTKSMYFISIIVPLIKITAIAGLILFYGIWGAVYGYILAEAILAIMLWYLFISAKEKNQVKAASTSA
jgi:O-antigen/teichoic acid export membrane protein